jgi:hypothetical protein
VYLFSYLKRRVFQIQIDVAKTKLIEVQPYLNKEKVRKEAEGGGGISLKT